MITYVNRENADKYSFLYSRASEDLRTHDGSGKPVKYGDANAVKGFEKITLTAESYQPSRYYIRDEKKGYKVCTDDDFTEGLEYYISDDITSLDEYFSYIADLNNISRRYTILPLDEEVFTIDANARTITVPKSFATNGIGVQGDEVAEIVYFKINRFFDSTDLDTRDIYIQWRSAAVDENGAPIEGVSVPWVKDVESEPGYIIFGWPLSSKITQKAGTIQFAVRFYEFNKDTDTLTYSLSTLTQTAVIKPALDFNLPSIILGKDEFKVVDDATAMIHDRFENTELNNGAVKAETPVWTKNLSEHLVLDVDKDGFRNVDVTRDVQAISTDGGQISYIWKKYSLADDSRQDIVHVISMKKTEDTERESGVLYYRKDGGDDSEVYVLYNGTFEEADANKITIYEKFSTGTITGVGKYYVIATNRVRQSTASSRSVECIVPYPVAPTINTNIPTSNILRPEDYDITLKPVSSITDEGKLTYQWFRQAPGTEEFEPIEGATDEELTVDGSADENPATGGEGDGVYKVEITNNLNKEKATVTSNLCRVTHAACKPEIRVIGESNFTLGDIVTRNKVLKIEASIPATSGEQCQRIPNVDTIEYQWYKYRKGLNNTVEEDVLLADDGLYELDSDTIMEGATDATFKPSATGYYFCLVTNKYNGTQATKISKFFNVIDADSN